MTTTLSSPTSLGQMAAAAKADRNRAIDAYRAIAMIAVAVGHWMAMAIWTDETGAPQTANALVHAPGMAWISWLFQVMPLFFVVGGFASAMSLDAHSARTNESGYPSDWVVARLRRMIAPAIVLALTWLGLMAVGTVAGVGAIVGAGAVAAAIPLWFLSNYTIDTAIAPITLPLFRRNPKLFMIGGLGLFGLLEALRFTGEPVLHHFNWVLGWLLFQVAGFAWRDGLLPTGAKMLKLSVALWAAAIAVVAFGPYPVAMVHIPGVELSPTYPPSLALMLFGAAYSTTAIAAAPRVSAWLSRNATAWKVVVAANTVAMSVYLWHFTAASIAGAVFYALGLLPTAEIGTAAWWLQKMPLLAASTLVLAGLVAAVARFERNALLAERTAWNGSARQLFGLAMIVSVAFKVWVLGSPVGAAIGASVLCVVWFARLRSR